MIAAGAIGGGRVSRRLMAAGVIAAILPDADVIGFRLGIAYGAEFGHRGASHSAAAAVLLGLLAWAAAARLKAPPAVAFLFVAASAASHGLTDMLTNGGRGVALWWPLSDVRLFWPARPVEVAPFGLRALTDGSLGHLLASEGLWLILPAVAVGLLYRLVSHPHIDLTKGQS